MAPRGGRAKRKDEITIDDLVSFIAQVNRWLVEVKSVWLLYPNKAKRTFVAMPCTSSFSPNMSILNDATVQVRPSAFFYRALSEIARRSDFYVVWDAYEKGEWPIGKIRKMSEDEAVE